MNSQPSVYMRASGVVFALSQKSYAYLPRVSDGQFAGSTPINSMSFFPAILSPMKGAISPPKLEPPPTQPMIVSGSTPYLSSAAFASNPMTGLVQHAHGRARCPKRSGRTRT